jgi:hypothetical protein
MHVPAIRLADSVFNLSTRFSFSFSITLQASNGGDHEMPMKEQMLSDKANSHKLTEKMLLENKETWAGRRDKGELATKPVDEVWLKC